MPPPPKSGSLRGLQLGNASLGSPSNSPAVAARRGEACGTVSFVGECPWPGCRIPVQQSVMAGPWQRFKGDVLGLDNLLASQVVLALWGFYESYVRGLLLKEMQFRYDFLPVRFPVWPLSTLPAVGSPDALLPWNLVRLLVCAEAMASLIPHRVARILHVLLLSSRLLLNELHISSSGFLLVFLQIGFLMFLDFPRHAAKSQQRRSLFVTWALAQLVSDVLSYREFSTEALLVFCSAIADWYQAEKKTRRIGVRQRRQRLHPALLLGALALLTLQNTVLVPASVQRHAQSSHSAAGRESCVLAVFDRQHLQDRPFVRSPFDYFSEELAATVCSSWRLMDRFGQYLLHNARTKLEMEDPFIGDTAEGLEMLERLDDSKYRERMVFPRI